MDDENLIPDNPGSRDVERAAREALFLGAMVETAGRSESGRIRNISRTGALLEVICELAIGSTITVSFRGVDRCRAIVKRRTSKGYGIQFEQAIDPSVCRQPVSTPTAKGEEFLLNLRESNRRPIWDTSRSTFKRPGTKA